MDKFNVEGRQAIIDSVRSESDETADAFGLTAYTVVNEWSAATGDDNAVADLLQFYIDDCLSFEGPE